KEMPSYLKDTTDVIKIIKNIKWENGYFLVTSDVTALYTSISHEKGCKMIQECLEKSSNFSNIHILFLIDSIRWILENNYFNFNSKFYLQLQGTAMGTRFAPSYANLFMSGWESEVIYNSHNWGTNLVSYHRYINDIFFIWKGTQLDLELFFS
ncbi:Hypothetical predicted protein, partial [Pelobates cultripes]